MLYNELQKQRYIDQSDMTEETIHVFKVVSTTAAKVELQEGKDLVFFTRNQVIKLLKAYNSKSKSYLRLICKHFSNYYEWCIEESIVDSGDITNWYDIKLAKPIIDEVLPLKLIEEKYFDKETMMEYVDSVIDVTNKLLLYAPYIGIDGKNHEDLKYLCIDDIDSVNKTIKLHSGKIIKIDRYFYDLAHQANESYKYDKNGMGDDVRGRSQYGKSKYIFKVCNFTKVDEPIGRTSLIQRYNVIKEQTGNNLLNIKLIYKNGLINHIKEYFSLTGVSLKEAFFEKKVDGVTKYKYSNELEDAINEFGASVKPELLRMQVQEIIDLYE